MDDLKEQLNQILSDPQSMQQLQSMASALGLGNQQDAPPPPAAGPAAPPAGGMDPSALAGMLSALGGGGNPNQLPAQTSPQPVPGMTPELLQTVSRLAPLLSQINREDDSTRLLQALRPLLSDKRQKKLDEAVRILQMMRLMPLLKDSGLFSGLLSGLL